MEIHFKENDSSGIKDLQDFNRVLLKMLLKSEEENKILKEKLSLLEKMLLESNKDKIIKNKEIL